MAIRANKRGGEDRRGDASLEGNFLFLYTCFLMTDGGKTVMSGTSFPAGKARRIFLLPPLLFLVSTSLGSLLYRLRREGAVYYKHTISFTGESFSYLVGTPFFEAQRRRLYNLWENRFLVFGKGIGENCKERYTTL